MKYILLTTLMLGSLLRSDAQDLGWAAQLGGTLFDHAYAVMTDDSGHVYTTGSFEGFADLDPGPAFGPLRLVVTPKIIVKHYQLIQTATFT